MDTSDVANITANAESARCCEKPWKNAGSVLWIKSPLVPLSFSFFEELINFLADLKT